MLITLMTLLGAALAGLILVWLLAERADRRLARRIHGQVLTAGRSGIGARTVLSGRDMLKAAKVIEKSLPLLRVAGYGRRSIRAIYPILLIVEGLVYRGDHDYEDWQRGGTAEGGWHRDLADYLSSIGADDAGIRSAIDDLRRYFKLESAMVTSPTPPTERMMTELARLRSSDVVLMVRIAFLFRATRVDEGFLRLVRPWLAIEEIREDLTSYDDDVAAGAFNTLDMYIRMYGDPGAKRLQALCARLLRTSISEMGRASSRSLARFWDAFAGRTGGVPVVAPTLSLLLPRAGHRLIAVAITRIVGGALGSVARPPAERAVVQD
ncbi:hypothetical protein [Salinispora vitiensis]|uniref:hypothetical protein n=1 Tax=Salinispora vitiensis TaxID=999544 RepID=UPI00037095CE|nr:hypothetical protein [Salinispora vitiensis]